MPDQHRATAVARALLEAGSVTLRPHQPVTFKSGLRSPVYVDNRRLIFAPGPWHTVIEAFGSVIRPARGESLAGWFGDLADPGSLVIAGVESAGIPHSSALAYHLGQPSVFVRKAAKDHGLTQRIEGGDVTGRRVVLVEDMVTTGGSSLSAIEALRGGGAVAEHCLAIITYGFSEATAAFAEAGVSLTTLTTFEVVVEQALERGVIDGAEARLVREWLADPHGWDGR